MSFVVVIPARYASTRLPAKPLADIGGKPMIVRVYEQALASGASRVIVATDDQRVADAAAAHGAEVCMTSSDHRSGTERIAEVIRRCGIGDEAIVVNVQGDEPLIPPANIGQVAALLEQTAVPMATLATPLTAMDELTNPNVVKVVADGRGMALYFSRAAIPWWRDGFAAGLPVQLPASNPWLRHIGIYAYRAGFVQRYLDWPVSSLEELESLEQLRVLYHGEQIAVAVAAIVPPTGVDTPEDLERVRQLVAAAS
ncbi:MAG: 3-deoxy-manno-octulosonate cytidylyltransferase [Gammaproteobacteria bacterium]|nr:3-deoxy-manno-octulosonate cytidylyltransferase [Gammaproteobacteria bacterium]